MSDQENTKFTPENNDQASQQDGQQHTDNPSEQLLLELEELKIKYQEMSEAFLRAKAETENNRKRALEEEAKARKFAVEGFAKGLLPVKDSLEAALNTENQTVEVIREGVETTLKQLAGTFTDYKVLEVAPQPGDKLDPNMHQAIAVVPTNEQAPNTIKEVLQKGYSIHDRVLRPAMVIVASAQE
ncbi:MAG: nucleotide exchange factor GrpE [Saezia sp.]